MAQKTKNIKINIVGDTGTFTTFFKKVYGKKEDYDFEGISALRRLLSNERSRILHIIKQKSPKSIYHLSRILERDFKSVNQDVKLLERFGFLELIPEKTGNRERLKPVILADKINIELAV